MIIIEKNVPLPILPTPKYPFSEMEVGDSFFVEGITHRSMANISGGATRKMKGVKFTALKVDNGVRVWRVQ